MPARTETPWTDWRGVGELPEAGQHIELRFRNGERGKTRIAPAWRWTDTGDDYDIVAYRVLL